MAYRETKYIVYLECAVEVMIIFPSVVVHADVARRLCGRDAVISAGFLDVGAEMFPSEFHCEEPGGIRATVTAYGESESLGVKSRPEDSALAQRTLVG